MKTDDITKLVDAMIEHDARIERGAKAESDRRTAAASKFWQAETKPETRGAASLESILGTAFLS